MGTVKPAILMLILFLLIVDKTRGMIFGAFSGVRGWVAGLSPASLTILAILLGALSVGFLLMACWPKSRTAGARKRAC
jgi:hypothetical protein